MANENKAIEEAKNVLTECGYAVTCLWHIRDVKTMYPYLSDDECQKVLEEVLSHEGLTEEHFNIMDIVVNDDGGNGFCSLIGGQVVTEGGDHFSIGAFVQYRGTRGLMIGPGAVVDFAAADFDAFARNCFDLDLEERCRVGKTFLMGEAGHAIGTQRAAGYGVEHRAIAGIEVVLALVALVAIG